ncbi:MAG: hypothetical protein KAS12_01850 [Candidatus Aenigmarchaeota archaeon]|nr:hypothetical protein [Candidatus Aenigmarchaeota archaeon]
MNAPEITDAMFNEVIVCDIFEQIKQIGEQIDDGRVYTKTEIIDKFLRSSIGLINIHGNRFGYNNVEKKYLTDVLNKLTFIAYTK